MAKIHMNDFIESIKDDLIDILKTSVKLELPANQINERYLVKRFEEELEKRFGGWQEIGDSLIKKD